MHGLGNDFVVLDGISQAVALTPRAVPPHRRPPLRRRLRPDPAGRDGRTRDDVDFRYRIFNADGGEVEQCGNGARCFVRFVHDKGLTDKTEIRVETASGVIEPRLETDGQVTVDMGAPRFAPADIPVRGRGRGADLCR